MGDVINEVIEWSISRGIHTQTPNRNGYIANKVEELGEYAEATKKGDLNDTIDAIADSMIFDITELGKHNLNPTLVLEEVLKVLNSRCGHWDCDMCKFIKDTSEKAKKLWYEPDYINNCKIGSSYCNLQGEMYFLDE